MSEQILLMTEHGWGLNVVMKARHDIVDSNFLETIKIIIRKCKETGKSEILIDATDTVGYVSSAKIYEVIEFVPKVHITGYRIAMIAPHLVDNVRIKYVENTGINMGISFQCFTNKKEAKEWLLISLNPK